MAIFVAVTSASIISWMASHYEPPLYVFGVIWIGIFAITITILILCFADSLLPLRNRLKNSTSWPLTAKIVNGLCWATPFAMIFFVQPLYPYLILLGIGAGNISTYLLSKKYNLVSTREQYMVGIASLSFIPLAILINSMIFSYSVEPAIIFSRLLIGIAYGIGGVYALLIEV
jgi:hypothetical protein